MSSRRRFAVTDRGVTTTFVVYGQHTFTRKPTAEGAREIAAANHPDMHPIVIDDTHPRWGVVPSLLEVNR